jgi:hypothetical protein
MTSHWNAIRFVAAEQELSRILDLTRRLIENCLRRGDIGAARNILDELRRFLRCLHENLSADLRDYKVMTSGEAQEAIYVIKLLEGSLQTDYPELSL